MDYLLHPRSSLPNASRFAETPNYCVTQKTGTHLATRFRRRQIVPCFSELQLSDSNGRAQLEPSADLIGK